MAQSDVNSYQFIQSAGPEIQTQVNSIPEITSRLSEVNSDLLNPVSEKNSETLRNLRDVQAVLDGNSNIHKTIATDGNTLSKFSSTDYPASAAAMKAALKATREHLISQHESVRTGLENDLVQFNEKMNTKILPNFTASLINMTTDSIRNVSRSIRAIGNFWNSTYANNKSDINTSLLFDFAPRLSRDILILRNIIDKQSLDVKKIETKTVPDSLAVLNSTILQTVTQGEKDIGKLLSDETKEAVKVINTTALGIGGNLDTLITSTRIDLSSKVATERTEIGRILVEMNNTIFAYENLETRTVNLLNSLQTQLNAVSAAKTNSLSNLIFPITKGLGAALMSAQQELSDSANKFVNDLNDTQSSMKDSISQSKVSNLANYTNYLESIYSDLQQNVEKNLSNLIDMSNAYMVTMEKSLRTEVAAMGPQTQSLSASVSFLMSQTTDLLRTAQQLMAAKLESIREQNRALFEHTNSTLTSELTAQKSSVDNMKNQLSTTFTELQNFFDSSLNDFDSNGTFMVSNMTKTFEESVADFQSKIVSWPTVDAKQLNERVETIVKATGDMSNRVTEMGDKVEKMKSDFLTKTSGLTVDGGVTDSAILTNLASEWHQRLDSAGAAVRTEVAKTVNETRDKNDYIGASISTMTKSVTDQFAEMESIVGKNVLLGPEPPTIANVQTDANGVATSMQVDRDELNDLIQELRNGFSRNSSQDVAAMKTFIESNVANLINAYQSAIAANLSDNNQISSGLGNLMSRISSEITYSSDLSSFKQSLQKIAANLNIIDSMLEDKSGDVTGAASALASLVNVTIMPGIRSAISSVSADDHILSDFSNRKIPNFVSSQNGAIDKVVNDTKSDISRNLTLTFGTTLQALSDYIDYVSGGARTVSDQLSFIQHETQAAAIQLHNITGTNGKTVEDATTFENIESRKNEAVLKRLLNEARNLKSSESTEAEQALHLFDSLNQIAVEKESAMIKNFTDLVSDVTVKVDNFTRSRNVERLEDLVNSTIHASRLRHGKSVEKIQNETKGLTDGLEHSAILHLLHELGGVDQSQSRLSLQIGDVLRKVGNASGDSGSKMRLETKQKSMEELQSMDNVLTGVTAEVPREFAKEGEQALGYMHQLREDLTNMIAAHKFPTIDDEGSITLLSRDRLPNIGNAIRRSRASIKETVKFVKPNKDFSDEFKSMEDKMMSLRKKQDYLGSQRKRIETYFATDPKV